MLTAADMATAGAHAFDYSPTGPLAAIANGCRRRTRNRAEIQAHWRPSRPRVPSSSAGPLSGG